MAIPLGTVCSYDARHAGRKCCAQSAAPLNFVPGSKMDIAQGYTSISMGFKDHATICDLCACAHEGSHELTGDHAAPYRRTRCGRSNCGALCVVVKLCSRHTTFRADRLPPISGVPAWKQVMLRACYRLLFNVRKLHTGSLFNCSLVQSRFGQNQHQAGVLLSQQVLNSDAFLRACWYTMRLSSP